MEKVENGSLDKRIFNLDLQVAVQIALGIIDGLEYVHSQKITHRDLKPQNILLWGPQLIPKITDFGVSKVIQTIITNSSMVGTPKYAAPELLQAGSHYGFSADIFSLAVILFEMFSGQPAEKGLGTNVMQIMLSVVQGRRPTFPANFPTSIKSLIALGWDQDPTKRTSLHTFRQALLTMVKIEQQVANLEIQPQQKAVRVSMIQQSSEIAKVALPLPMLSLMWNSSVEVLNSQHLRERMVEDLRTKSNMNGIINESVLSVLKVVPRHLFIEESRLEKSIQSNRQEIVNAAYLYNKPIPATKKSNESSPEIIGAQLSFTEIIQGQSILLVGIKGGYIQSLVAQLVGFNGLVATVTSDSCSLQVCRERVNLHSPLKNVVNWIQIDNIKNQSELLAALQQKQLLFHVIIYCGAVDQFPNILASALHSTGNVSIMVPVKVNDNNQRFQLYQRRGSKTEIRTITDFGVIFEEIH